MRIFVLIVLGIGLFMAGVVVSRMHYTPAPQSSEITHDAKVNAVSTSSQVRTIDARPMLSQGQAQFLTKLGIDPSSITITPAMIACAEAKLGKARLEELQGGATPSMSEGMTLLACYRN